MKQLELAIQYYTEQLGEAPPFHASLADIERHAQISTNSKYSAKMNFNNFVHDIAKLDDRETLTFWLGGEAWQSILPSSSLDQYFDFRPDQLTDIDDDGWCEYTDGYGNFFVLRDGQVYLFNKSTQSEHSIDDLRLNK